MGTTAGRRRRLVSHLGAGVCLTLASAGGLAVRESAAPAPAAAAGPAPAGSPPVVRMAATSPLAPRNPPPPPGNAAPSSFRRDEVVLVDPSRPNPQRAVASASGGSPPGRVLRVLLVLPPAPLRRVPLVVFAHGFDSEPERYAPLLEDLAQQGYAVAAPESPESAADLPGAPSRDAIADQTRDLSFVLGALLAAHPTDFDPSRLVFAGHSDGGSAVAAAALMPGLEDKRVRSFVVLSGALSDTLSGEWGAGLPSQRLLVVVGDHDEFGNLSASEEVYARAGVAKELAVVPGGDHLGIYLSSDPVATAVRAAVSGFLRATLADVAADAPLVVPPAGPLAVTTSVGGPS